jgi:hypothetical protein
MPGLLRLYSHVPADSAQEERRFTKAAFRQ